MTQAASATDATDGDAAEPKRIGLLGGTFDPVHWGHLLLAECAREACGLDEVWFVPAAAPPHKPGRAITLPRHRLQMLELATAGLPQFVVSNIEIGREGPSYTVDTLTAIHEQRPNADLHFLMGADSLKDLPTWRQPERIAELATIVAVSRGEAIAAVPTDCGPYSDRIRLVPMPACGLSATDLRERAKSGRSLLFRTPRPVELYIREHSLYG